MFKSVDMIQNIIMIMLRNHYRGNVDYGFCL